MLFRSISISLAVLGAAALCAPVSALNFSNSNSQAAPPFTVSNSQTVSYSDLDVSREAGARVLLNRIKAAAGKVCGAKPTSILEFAAIRARDACMKQAIASSVQASGAPLVAQLYNTGTSGITASTGN